MDTSPGATSSYGVVEPLDVSVPILLSTDWKTYLSGAYNIAPELLVCSVPALTDVEWTVYIPPEEISADFSDYVIVSVPALTATSWTKLSYVTYSHYSPESLRVSAPTLTASNWT